MYLSRELNEAKEKFKQRCGRRLFQKERGQPDIFKKSRTKTTMSGAGESKRRRRGDQRGRMQVIQLVRNQGIASLVGWVKLVWI